MVDTYRIIDQLAELRDYQPTDTPADADAVEPMRALKDLRNRINDAKATHPHLADGLNLAVCIADAEIERLERADAR